MACACNSNRGGAPTAPTSYVVTAPGGITKTYRTEVEAAAAAKRLNGTYKAS